MSGYLILPQYTPTIGELTKKSERHMFMYIGTKYTNVS